MLVSITVTFHPDLAALERQLISLKDQVDLMLVVDNGSPPELHEELALLCAKHNALLESLPCNAGIAHAQNIGIAQARKQGATHMLLMDQDSEATPGMVTKLLEALKMRPNAAAAGPCSVDQRTGRRTVFVLDDGIWPRRWNSSPEQKDTAFEVGFLIASGCLLRASCLLDDEPMRASWFIDQIDAEWCLRMRAKNWVILGVADALLSHRLGDKVTRFWLFRWWQVAHHSPLRHYYIFRNSILLARASYLPWRWKLFFLTRLIRMAWFFLFFTPDRLHNAIMMGRGIIDGVFGRTGPWK